MVNYLVNFLKIFFMVKNVAKFLNQKEDDNLCFDYSKNLMCSFIARYLNREA